MQGCGGEHAGVRGRACRVAARRRAPCGKGGLNAGDAPCAPLHPVVGARERVVRRLDGDLPPRPRARAPAVSPRLARRVPMGSGMRKTPLLIPLLSTLAATGVAHAASAECK